MVQALPLSPADQLARTLAKELPEPSRADFLRLTRALLHGPRFQWLLAEVPSDALRDRLISALDRVMIVAHLQCSRLPLDRSLADVPALEAALARHAKGCAVVHVLGRRGWFDAARWDAFNVRRERVALEARARLVFWLDAEAIEAASLGAPDLWAWRSGVYSFSEPSAVAVAASEATAPHSSGPPIDIRSRDERLQRIVAIQQWLVGEGATVEDGERVGPVDELGRLLYSIGAAEEALRHWREVELPLHVRRGDEWAAAVTKGQIADILQARGQLDEALRIRQEEQLPVYERLGDVREAAITKAQIGLQLLERGEPQGGERLLRQALSALQAMKLPEADQIAAQMHARGLATEGKAASS